MEIKNLILNQQNSELPTSFASIAVHLHLFYPDLIPVFLQYLEHIPAPFSLFISVPEGVVTDDAEVEKTFLTLSNVEKTVIKHTPNRGRDLAPMLCSFKEEIQKHDIILHLHTKKSPYKSLHEGWLTHILKHLLPERSQLSTMLSLLSKDTGIIGPPDYINPLTPDGWGDCENIIQAQELLNRCGMDISLKEEYKEIDFPQGSMIWARTDYLKRFFSLGLTYNDFPEEPIAADGTIAHALERLFFVWGRDTGLSACKVYLYDVEAETHQHLWNEMNILRVEREYFIKKYKSKLALLRMLMYSALLLVVLVALSIWLFM